MKIHPDFWFGPYNPAYNFQNEKSSQAIPQPLISICRPVFAFVLPPGTFSLVNPLSPFTDSCYLTAAFQSAPLLSLKPISSGSSFMPIISAKNGTNGENSPLFQNPIPEKFKKNRTLSFSQQLLNKEGERPIHQLQAERWVINDCRSNHRGSLEQQQTTALSFALL